VKASPARKHWFQLPDDALRGEVIAIERKGGRVLLRREEPSSAKRSPDYKKILKVPRADEADRWSWEWRGPGHVVSRRRS
jgi:hypothetical protein